MEEIQVGSDFSGVGAFEQALLLLNIKHKNSFACDLDKYARLTYLAKNGTKQDLEILKTADCKFIDDVYYRGFVNTNLKKPTKKEWNQLKELEEKVANQFSFYYPWNVYSRTIPTKPIDVYMTSPPCQGFSIAGARGGSILFHNSYEFIKTNKPRFFIFENVKGLLSHDKTGKNDKKVLYGKTFTTWLNYLGGKSVNGNPVLFPMDQALPYHIYHAVLNTKHFGIPQNRERVFIIGIRDDADNNFSYPKETPLVKRLKDVLETNVDKKYYLSDKMLDYLLTRKDNFNNGKINYKSADDVASCINASSKSLDISDNILKLGNVNPSGNGMNGNVYSEDGIAPALPAKLGGDRSHNVNTSRTRRLTPLECFRLQGFPDEVVQKAIAAGVSDSQLYKQAGNSITREVLAAILNNLLRTYPH